MKHSEQREKRTKMKCVLVFILLMTVVVEGGKKRKPKVHRGHVVGPVGFNLPDLTKIPSTKFDCFGNKRYFINFTIHLSL